MDDLIDSLFRVELELGHQSYGYR